MWRKAVMANMGNRQVDDEAACQSLMDIELSQFKFLCLKAEVVSIGESNRLFRLQNCCLLVLIYMIIVIKESAGRKNDSAMKLLASAKEILPKFPQEVLP